jgi:hypothetical protein
MDAPDNLYMPNVIFARKAYASGAPFRWSPVVILLSLKIGKA